MRPQRNGDDRQICECAVPGQGVDRGIGFVHLCAVDEHTARLEHKENDRQKRADDERQPAKGVF